MAGQFDDLVDAILRWSSLCVRPRDAAPIDATFVRDYAEVLGEVRVTPDELRFAARVILAKSKFFPSPAEVIEVVMELRRKIAEASLRQAYAEPWVPMIEHRPDGTTVEVFGPASHADNERLSLLPEPIRAVPASGKGRGARRLTDDADRAVAIRKQVDLVRKGAA